MNNREKLLALGQKNDSFKTDLSQAGSELRKGEENLFNDSSGFREFLSNLKITTKRI
jgi:hypothetical protein